MKTHMRIFVMAGILISFSVFASETEYVYFNLSSCTQGVIGSSSYPNDKDFKLLESQAETWIQNNPNSYTSPAVFQAGDDKSFGICLMVHSKNNKAGTYNRVINELIFQESSVNNFPLAGTTYKLIKDKGALPSYACVKGCKATTPRIIHDLGYESPEEWRNVEYEKALKEFNGKCKPESK
ncbi:MAG: hypothetical protein HOO97_07220 [Sideroxydans sp.]|nr:hypothetical protein [Sideroxydans sp.]